MVVKEEPIETKKEIKPEVVPEVKSEESTTVAPVKRTPRTKAVKPASTTIDRLKKEALGKTEEKEEKPEIEEKITTIDLREIEKLNVHQLRRLARSTENFPIQGRVISRANRRELLDYFKTMVWLSFVFYLIRNSTKCGVFLCLISFIFETWRRKYL